MLAGTLSILLVIGRMPPFDRLVTDPMFFRRCLVVHVDLALVVWFWAFVAALMFALPARGRSSKTSRASVALGTIGVAMLMLSALGGGEPVLANYVPMIAHPGFALGLILFGAGVIASFLDVRLFPGGPKSDFLPLPDAAEPSLRATAVALVIAALTFATSYAVAPDGLAPSARFELANWGGGHVLQMAISCALATAWFVLVGGALGKNPIARDVSFGIFAVGLLPWLAAPLLAARGVQSIESREIFTRLMQFGIFPMMLVVLALLVRAIAKNRAVLSDARVWGFGVSAGLTVLGWILGAAIRGPTTMVPAHYHASIGAVTAAFMTLSYPLMARFGAPVLRPRIARVQPIVYGIGQMIFAAGFALAGAHGMARKVYGAEQHVRSLSETIGLVVMGAGGLVAVTGGLAFLFLVISAWRSRRSRRALSTWRMSHGVDEKASTAEADGQPVAALGARGARALPLVHGVGMDRAHEHETRGVAVKGAHS